MSGPDSQKRLLNRSVLCTRCNPFSTRQRERIFQKCKSGRVTRRLSSSAACPYTRSKIRCLPVTGEAGLRLLVPLHPCLVLLADDVLATGSFSVSRGSVTCAQTLSRFSACRFCPRLSARPASSHFRCLRLHRPHSQRPPWASAPFSLARPARLVCELRGT